MTVNDRTETLVRVTLREYSFVTVCPAGTDASALFQHVSFAGSTMLAKDIDEQCTSGTVDWDVEPVRGVEDLPFGWNASMLPIENDCFVPSCTVGDLLARPGEGESQVLRTRIAELEATVKALERKLKARPRAAGEKKSASKRRR